MWDSSPNLATLPPNTGSRRSQTCQAPGVLALREHIRRAVLRCGQDGEDRRSGASFCAASTMQNADYVCPGESTEAPFCGPATVAIRGATGTPDRCSRQPGISIDSCENSEG
jgi:hypothetical protein